MNYLLMMAVGVCIGLILSLIYTSKLLNEKQKEKSILFDNLNEALNIRYLRLKDLMTILKKHMEEYHDKINSLMKLLDESLFGKYTAQEINDKIQLENTINYYLEEIKSAMGHYSSISADSAVNNAINSIIESETNVQIAMIGYNQKAAEYNLILSTFPVSFMGQLIGKKPDAIPFEVANILEFQDNYIDEDEI